ncbi:MAG: 8-oxo-dGTP diphosphatase MutT [Eubacteriales bacterium]
METVVVTAAIIKNSGKFLIAQRKMGAHQEMKWEFPGGKVEKGEDPEACLKREIQEELNISIEVKDIYKVVSHNYETKHIILLCYTCKITSGEPQAVDCQDFRWVKPGEMSRYEFATADIPVVRELCKD